MAVAHSAVSAAGLTAAASFPAIAAATPFAFAFHTTVAALAIAVLGSLRPDQRHSHSCFQG